MTTTAGPSIIPVNLQTTSNNRKSDSPKRQLQFDEPRPSGSAKYNGNDNTPVDDRTKVLTMKYGKHQMALIRKRIRVESWLLESLEQLYGDEDLAENCELANSIDDLLDLISDIDRQNYIQDKLHDCSAKEDTIRKFVQNFLAQLQTL